MLIIILQIAALLAMFMIPVFIMRYKSNKKITNSKTTKSKYHIDRDTSYARYAINEKGFLEEINEGKLLK